MPAPERFRRRFQREAKPMTRSDDRSLSPEHRSELGELIAAHERTTPKGSRRDFMRWSALAAGALATAKYGVAAAAPSAGTAAVARYATGDVDKNVTINVPLLPFPETVTLDPHRSVNWGAFWTMFPNVWGGLVRYDQNGKVVLDLAESFTTSTDGTIYTFKIRPDAKYASGAKVVAADFVASWKRALTPTRLSPMATFMSGVKGYAKYTTSKSKDIGFKAVDDSTVQITLDKPYSFFMSYLAAFVWSVIDPAVLKSKGDDKFMLADAGTGPWRFTSFDAAKQVVMEPNTNYYGGNSPSIVKIVWPIVSGPTAAADALELYKQDKAISADVSISLKSAVEKDPTLSAEMVKITPSSSTRSIAMDFNQPPFNDVRVRRALALAIDRAAWANDIWEGTWTPTAVFTPPVVNLNEGYQPPAGIDQNVDQAKQLLTDAGFKDGAGLPPITFYEPSEDLDDDKARWKAFFDAIKTAVGITIAQDTTKSFAEITQLQTDNGGRQFDVPWWWTVTDTPHLLSDVFASTSPYMKGVFNWSSTLAKSGDFDPGADSKAFDDLVQKADVELDQAKRNDLYKQAEELALKNAVYIPIGNWIQMYVQKPWIQGTKQGPWTGRLPALFDKDVVALKH
jgi:oligopeptide transport system substrate-binding protein